MPCFPVQVKHYAICLLAYLLNFANFHIKSLDEDLTVKTNTDMCEILLGYKEDKFWCENGRNCICVKGSKILWKPIQNISACYLTKANPVKMTISSHVAQVNKEISYLSLHCLHWLMLDSKSSSWDLNQFCEVLHFTE